LNKPNIIIFYTDDQGTLDAGCYGSKDLYTPNMDALANKGVRFTQAYSHTVCCPSRAALLTGRYPQRCGINNWTSNHPSDENKTNLNLDEITIAQYLKKAKYKTALIGKWHCGANLNHGPTKFGFDLFFGHRGGFIDNYKHKFLHSRVSQPPFHDLWLNEKEIYRDGLYFPDMVVNQAKIFLEKNKNDPFFLYVPFNLPHYPYQPDEDFFEKYSNLSEPRRSYGAMVSTVDRRIGQIMAKVDELGLRKKTLIIHMSDNGHSEEDYHNWDFNYGAQGGGGNTGKWRGSKGTFFEGGIRVPAIISMPNKIPEGEIRNQIITNMDFLPTILDLCNLSKPDNLDGYSIWPIINNKAAKSRYNNLYFQWQNSWMVREDSWKLINTMKDDKYISYLTNIDEENPEMNNYINIYPKIVKHLNKLYKNWEADVFK
jgi:arylsulfatase A